MKHYFIKFNTLKTRIIISLLFLFLINTTVIPLIFPSTVNASRMSQPNRTLPLQSTLSPTITSSTLLVAPTPTADDRVQQLITEAQNDISAANTIIYWTGFIFAVIVGIVTVGVGIAGFSGIREFRDLFSKFETTRDDIETTRDNIGLQYQQVSNQLQQMIALKEQIENQSTLLTNQIQNQLHTIQEQSDQFTKKIQSQLQTVEDRFKQLAKSTEIQSILDASYHYNKASQAYDIGDNHLAIDAYLQVLDLQPNNTKVLERLGRAYSNINEIDLSVKKLEKALDIDPFYAPALRSLALTYRYLDKAKAINYLERELEINKFDFEGHDFLGLFYRDEGFFDKAINQHEKALAIEKRPETEFYLSILYALKGDKKRAYLMATLADDDLVKKEHSDRIRPIWRDLIRAAVPIYEDNENEAYKLVASLSRYIRTQRTYEAVKGHLKFLLEATGHETWKQKFISVLKVQ